MQLRQGTVSVTNNSQTVKGTYVANINAVTGVFTPGEILTWGINGFGVVVRHDTIGNKLYFTRDSGTYPVVTQNLSNQAATKGCTIVSFASDSVPNFTTELGSPGGSLLFTIAKSGVVYGVAPFDLDTLTLTGNYIGDTYTELSYAVIRDFSYHYLWPVPAPSDTEIPTVLSRTFFSVDNALWGPEPITPTLSGDWVGPTVRYWKDSDRVVHLAGVCSSAGGATPTVFTLPVGYRPLYTFRVPIIVGTVSMGVLEVTAAGAVSAVSGSLGVAVYLDGVTFRGES